VKAEEKVELVRVEAEREALKILPPLHHWLDDRKSEGLCTAHVSLNYPSRSTTLLGFPLAVFFAAFWWGHDQADAEWVVIRGPLNGHDNMPSGGQPTAGLLAGWDF
jgi:hypothetical protein